MMSSRAGPWASALSTGEIRGGSSRDKPWREVERRRPGSVSRGGMELVVPVIARRRGLVAGNGGGRAAGENQNSGDAKGE